MSDAPYFPEITCEFGTSYNELSRWVNIRDARSRRDDMVRVRNTTSGEVLEFRGRVQEGVIDFLHANQDAESSTSVLAEAIGLSSSSVLRVCKRLRPDWIVRGYKGSGSKVLMWHADYGYITEQSINAISERFRAQGWSQAQIDEEIARIQREWEFRGYVTEWKWRWSADWMVV